MRAVLGLSLLGDPDEERRRKTSALGSQTTLDLRLHQMQSSASKVCAYVLHLSPLTAVPLHVNGTGAPLARVHVARVNRIFACY